MALYEIIRLGFPVRDRSQVREPTGLQLSASHEPTGQQAVHAFSKELTPYLLAGWGFTLEPVAEKRPYRA